MIKTNSLLRTVKEVSWCKIVSLWLHVKCVLMLETLLGLPLLFLRITEEPKCRRSRFIRLDVRYVKKLPLTRPRCMLFSVTQNFHPYNEKCWYNLMNINSWRKLCMYVNFVIYLWNTSVLATLKFLNYVTSNIPLSVCCGLYVYMCILVYITIMPYGAVFLLVKPLCVTAVDVCVYTL